MQVSVQKLSSVLLEFDVQVDAERVRTELESAYNRLAKSAKVRGFRPGKTPRSVLVHMFGPRVAADVAQRLVDETYPKAISEQKVQVVSQPAIEPRQIQENQPFSYKARVEVIPEIESVNFTGFEVQKPKVDVTDELLDAELLRVRRENATLEPIKADRGSQAGDVVSLEFEVEVEGKIIPDAGAKDFEIEIGAGRIIPEIEAAVAGKKAGEQAVAQAPISPQHPNKGIRGKIATFKLSIKDVKERVLPALDDEFAKDMGEYATLDDLKKELREALEKQQKEQSEMKVAEQLVAQLVKSNPIEVPPSLVQQQSRMTEQEVTVQARRSGQQGQLSNEVRQSIAQDSEVKVRAGLLMAAIAKQEQIKIGDAELEEGLKELAEQTGKNIAKLRVEYRDAKKREMLIGMILENKVLDIIEAKAKVQES